MDQAFTISSEPSAFSSLSLFDFGARQIEPLCGDVGALELSIDEKADGLVINYLMAFFTGKTSGDLLGRPACS